MGDQSTAVATDVRMTKQGRVVGIPGSEYDTCTCNPNFELSPPGCEDRWKQKMGSMHQTNIEWRKVVLGKYANDPNGLKQLWKDCKLQAQCGTQKRKCVRTGQRGRRYAWKNVQSSNTCRPVQWDRWGNNWQPWSQCEMDANGQPREYRCQIRTCHCTQHCYLGQGDDVCYNYFGAYQGINQRRPNDFLSSQCGPDDKCCLKTSPNRGKPVTIPLAGGGTGEGRENACFVNKPGSGLVKSSQTRCQSRPAPTCSCLEESTSCPTCITWPTTTARQTAGPFQFCRDRNKESVDCNGSGEICYKCKVTRSCTQNGCRCGWTAPREGCVEEKRGQYRWGDWQCGGAAKSSEDCGKCQCPDPPACNPDPDTNQPPSRETIGYQFRMMECFYQGKMHKDWHHCQKCGGGPPHNDREEKMCPTEKCECEEDHPCPVGEICPLRGQPLPPATPPKVPAPVIPQLPSSCPCPQPTCTEPKCKTQQCPCDNKSSGGSTSTTTETKKTGRKKSKKSSKKDLDGKRKGKSGTLFGNLFEGVSGIFKGRKKRRRRGKKKRQT